MKLGIGQPKIKRDGNILEINVPKQMEEAIPTGHPHIDLLYAGDGIIAGTVSLVSGGPGAGKCLGKGTPVLMYDGTVKPVEEIVVGDLLMGPDSLPRRVLSLARGREEMFRVIPTKGSPWECNRSHILSLVHTNTGEIHNISVEEYLGLSAKMKDRLKQYRSAVDFPTKELPIDPYMLGLWLGDGSKANTGITTVDTEISSYLRAYAEEHNYLLREYHHHKRPHVVTYRLVKPRKVAKRDNILRKTYRTALINGEKRIPHIFLTGDRKQRLRLLAGLVDTDGHLSHGGYEIITKYSGLSQDILFLSRSLGFSASSSKKKINNQVYHRVFIYGDVNQIPVRIHRKKASPRVQRKNVLRTGIKVESLGMGDYYGFQIDGDHLFMLGDFTVTHNTTLMLQLADSLTRTGHKAIVNTGEESLYQVRRVTKRLGLKHGFIPSYHRDVEDIIEHCEEIRAKHPDKHLFLIQDSLQCLSIRPSGQRGRPMGAEKASIIALEKLTEYAKNNWVTLFLIGHVNKKGEFAGKQTIKHIVDCHLHLSYDPEYEERVCEMRKNRFGIAGTFYNFDLQAKGLVFEAARPAAADLDLDEEDDS